MSWLEHGCRVQLSYLKLDLLHFNLGLQPGGLKHYSQASHCTLDWNEVVRKCFYEFRRDHIVKHIYSLRCFIWRAKEDEGKTFTLFAVCVLWNAHMLYVARSLED